MPPAVELPAPLRDPVPQHLGQADRRVRLPHPGRRHRARLTELHTAVEARLRQTGVEEGPAGRTPRREQAHRTTVRQPRAILSSIMDTDPAIQIPPGSLSGVGLTDAPESVYRAIVAQLAIQPDELVEATGLTVESVTASIGTLISRGLVDASGGTLTAVSPLLTLGDLVAKSERDARMARAALDELADHHRSIRQQEEFRGLEVIHGRANIGGWINHLMRATERELRLFAKPPFGVVGVAETDSEKELAVRGLAERVIIERSLLDEPETEQDLLASLDRGQQIRLAETLPSKLLIADDSMALVQLDEGGPSHDVVVVVRPGGLLTSLTTLFESLWERSIQPAGGSGTADRAVSGVRGRPERSHGPEGVGLVARRAHGRGGGDPARRRAADSSASRPASDGHGRHRLPDPSRLVRTRPWLALSRLGPATVAVGAEELFGSIWRSDPECAAERCSTTSPWVRPRRRSSDHAGR